MTPIEEPDVLYHGMLSPILPVPLLYLSAKARDTWQYLIPLVKRHGLPPLRIEGDPDSASLVVDLAKGDQWKVLVDRKGRSLTIEWPGERPLVYGGAMKGTPGWARTALDAEECWLLVGPPQTWRAPTTDLNTVIEHVWKNGGALGVVRVFPAPSMPGRKA